MAGAALDRLVHDLFGPLTVIRGVCATLARDEPRRRAARGAGADRRGDAAPRGRSRRPRPRHGAARTRAGRARAGRLARWRSRSERYRRASAPRAASRSWPGSGAWRRRSPPPATTCGAGPRQPRPQRAFAKRLGGQRSPPGAVAGWAQVRVATTGPGCRPADRERIFRPGERGSAPRGEGRASGSRSPARSRRSTAAASRSIPVGPGATFRLAPARCARPPAPIAGRRDGRRRGGVWPRPSAGRRPTGSSWCRGRGDGAAGAGRTSTRTRSSQALEAAGSSAPWCSCDRPRRIRGPRRCRGSPS